MSEHYTISTKFRSKNEIASWIREYEAGLHSYKERHVDAANYSLTQNKPTDTILACRKGLDVPVRSFDDMQVSEIHDTELRIISEHARLLIEPHKKSLWTAALGTYANTPQHHDAGIAAMELSRAHADKNNTSPLLNNFQAHCYRIAIKSMEAHVASLPDPDLHPSVAPEYDVSRVHFLEALGRLANHYAALRQPVDGQARNEVLRLAYKIDDIGGDLQLLSELYQLLADSSRFGERRFFRHEVRNIENSDGVLSRDVSTRPDPDKRPKQRRYTA